MKDQKFSGGKSSKKSHSKENNIEAVKIHPMMEAMVNEWRNEVASLTYDDSLKALDLLLEDLQNDDVPVEDLQKYYIRGNIYLNHCENLLKNVEHEVIQLSPENLI